MATAIQNLPPPMTSTQTSPKRLNDIPDMHAMHWLFETYQRSLQA